MFKNAIVGAVVAVAAMGAQADKIISAVDGVIVSGGPGFGSLTETFNQAGLSSNYVSGVTDFDSYIASGPTHTNIFAGFEWFSNSGTTSATVYYDMGAVKQLNGMALWNEESSGIGNLDLYVSTDAVTWTSVGMGITPTDNPLGPEYLADVYKGATVSARYVMLDMSGCPQANPGSFNACAIGEVAFSQAVPEPGTYALMAGGLALVGFVAGRRRKI